MKDAVLIFLILFLVVGCSQNKAGHTDEASQHELSARDSQLTKANQLVEAMQAHLAVGLADSASADLEAARNLLDDNDQVKDSFNQMAKELEQVRSEAFITETLGKLSPEGIKSLKAGDKMVYFLDKSINSYFLKQLKTHAGDWTKLHKDHLQLQAQEKQARIAVEDQEEKDDQAKAQSLAIERRSYAKVLRNNFLDNNLDVNVEVSGKNATHLTLKYVLFGAVWARKLQTGGTIAGNSLEDWHEMGFTKISLTDGYDYDSSFTF